MHRMGAHTVHARRRVSQRNIFPLPCTYTSSTRSARTLVNDDASCANVCRDE